MLLASFEDKDFQKYLCHFHLKIFSEFYPQLPLLVSFVLVSENRGDFRKPIRLFYWLGPAEGGPFKSCAHMGFLSFVQALPSVGQTVEKIKLL